MIQVGSGDRPITNGMLIRRDAFWPEGAAMAAFLRVYPPSLEPQTASDVPPATVCVRLTDLLPLLALARRNNYLWLQDFLDDEVVITEDLYQVLKAFRATRPSA
jgi:hypothetical protein